LQELLRRLQDRHVDCAEAVAKKAAADAASAATVDPDAPNVLQAMMLFQQAKNRAKATQDRAKAAQDEAKVANKVALQAEKDNDVAQKEVQELQRVMEPKRARTLPATADDDEECEKQSCDDWDLPDHRREATRIQNRRSIPLGSRGEVPTPQEGKAGPLEHSRLGLVGWIAYWSLGNSALALKIIVALIRKLDMTDSVFEALTPIAMTREADTNAKIVMLMKAYSFLFLGTPGHYCIRKYSCWCKACSLVRGRGHGAESGAQSLHVPGCLRSKLTVWKEDQFTVLPGQGIKQREVRVSGYTHQT
jgi:hypothetical protein